MARGVKKSLLLSQNPKCIYCGGGACSTTWDHMPNKGMFPKDRPGGLEFPSCYECNHGSKWFEDIASFVGSVQLASDGQKITTMHFTNKLTHLLKVHPNIADELRPTFRQKKEMRKVARAGALESAAFNLQGPTVSLALRLYGAKLALALHWAETGQILATTGQVGVICYSNEVKYKGGVPQDLFDMLPDQRTLKQGKKTSAYPFSFSSGKATDTDATAHWACFSDAFMYYLFAGQTFDFSILPPDHVFSPGCLQTPKPPPLAARFGWGISPDSFF